MNHVHVDKETVETTLSTLSLQSGNDLPNPDKDHPFYKGLTDDETPTIVVEQDTTSKDNDNQTEGEPNR